MISNYFFQMVKEGFLFFKVEKKKTVFIYLGLICTPLSFFFYRISLFLIGFFLSTLQRQGQIIEK